MGWGWEGGGEPLFERVPSCLFINIWKGKLLSQLLNCVIDFCSNRSCFISLWHSCGTFCTNVRELRGTRRLSRNRGPLLRAGRQDRDCAAARPLCVRSAVPPHLSLGWASLSRPPLQTALGWGSRCRSPWLTYCRVVGKFRIDSVNIWRNIQAHCREWVFTITDSFVFRFTLVHSSVSPAVFM